MAAVQQTVSELWWLPVKARL